MLYVVWAAAHTLASARSFYGYMLKQTGGEWSAPLDDVFIHFDYARATALGHPFEWTVGNGYSSGNTSLSYPFVLAAGYLAGFQGRELMVWAAIIAAVSVFAVLLAMRTLFIEDVRDDWGRVSSYALPPIFLAIGALDWSLWSGMEVAWLLAVWALAFVAWRVLEGDARRLTQKKRVVMHAWALGVAGALVVTTRPEAAVSVAAFGIAATQAHFRHGKRRAFGILVRAGFPSVVVLGLQSLVNKALTGEVSANGAIVKLALNNPYMTSHDKLEDWTDNAKYAALRNLEHHFAHRDGEMLSQWVPANWPTQNPLTHVPGVLARTPDWAGVVPFAIATLPLLFARTRRVAAIFWTQIVAWVLLVALNGQVRWQNERYVMPAVAWLLVMAALGVSVALRPRAGRHGTLAPGTLATLIVGACIFQVYGIVTRAPGTPPDIRLPWTYALAFGAAAVAFLRFRAVRTVLVAGALLFAYDHQIAKMRDQKWFFGRASRNIRDQHLTLGKYLAELKPNRVLVGDAGAILYESDRPGLDIIGLGGYHALPFARAGVHGLPATLELIERMPPADRPEVLAIFPTWWGSLPVWFGGDVLRRFPVEGNVICGGYEHIVYRADWHLLNTGDRLRVMPEGDTRVRAVVDVGDLVSEKEMEYAFARPKNGWTDARILPDPIDRQKDLFDGGRRIDVDRDERFVARGLVPQAPAHLVVRSAPESLTHVRVRVDGTDIGTLTFAQTGGWVEKAIAIPKERVTEAMHVELVNAGPGEFIDFHVWLTQ